MTTLLSFSKSFEVFSRTYSFLKRPRATEIEVQSLKSAWARETLASIGVNANIHGAVPLAGPVLLIGNHISYLDIPLLMLAAPGVSFLAKRELQYWPIFGSGAAAVGTIFVKREDQKDRAAARAAIADGLNRKRIIALFPSGTTCLNESKPWRRGAFEIARDLQIPIQPFRIRYTPLRQAAYIDRDFFPIHLYHLVRKGQITATVEFHSQTLVQNANDACKSWQRWAQEGL